jgi:transcriptional regulator, XRE family
MNTTQRFTSVWDALEDTPAEAENMPLRSALMVALKQHITQSGLTQAQAAALFGVTQPRISDLVRGKINIFSLDTLVNMASVAGLRIDMQIQPFPEA